MSPVSQSDQITTLDDLDVLVEADGHVTSTPDVVLPYMDEEFEDVRDFYERSPRGGFEFKPMTVASPLYLYERMKDREGKDGFTFYEPSGAKPLQEAMDRHDIDKAIANNLGSAPMRNPRHAAGFVNGYNNWMVDEFADYPNIYGNLLATPLDPSFSAEEIERVADEDTVVGVQLLGTTLVPLPNDRKYDPLWESAAEHSLPICIHTGTGPRAFPNQFHWSETYAEDHMSAHPMQHISILTSLILGGVLERYPDLTIVMQEAGIGYVPYLKQRLDATYEELGYELPDVNRPPSEYIDDSVYFCTQPIEHTSNNHKHLAWLIEMAGVENLIWASDIPHPDFDPPEELFQRVKSHFSDEELCGLMGGTAEQVFDI